MLPTIQSLARKHLRKPTMTPTHASPHWSTASFGGSTDTSPMELRSLGEHLSHCRGMHGRFFLLRCVAERVNQQVTGRPVTTLLVAALLLVGFGTLLA